MKQFITLSFIFICVNVSVAQSKRSTSNQLRSHRTFLNELIQQNNHKTASRAAESWASQRVIAQCTRDNTAAITDSVKLGYHPNDTSTYDYNMMEYAYNYPYRTSPLFNYMGIYTKPQVLFSSYHHWTINPNTLVYGFYQKEYAGYDINHNMTNDTSYFVDSSSNPNMIYLNKFNDANAIDSSYSFVYHLGVADSAFKQFFGYDPLNKLIKDSIYEFALGSWHLVSKTMYAYDGSDNLVQIDNYSNNDDPTFTLPLIEQLQYINTYDASHRMLTVQTSYYDGTSLTQYVKDTFAYSGTHPFHTSWKEYQYDAINTYWAPIINITKHLNTAGFPDTVNIESFDSLSNAWVPAAREIITYNSFSHPDTLYDYEYNFTSFPATPDFTTVYYYESFTNTTSVTTIEPGDHTTALYPNPASDMITVSGLNFKNNADVSIYSADGRIQHKEKLLSGIGNVQLVVTSLKPGIYFLIVQDDKGTMIYKQSFVKMIED